MKLVLEYDYGGGPESVVGHATIPVEYESAEALVVDFEEALKAAIARLRTRVPGEYFSGEFEFQGQRYDCHDFLVTDYLGLVERGETRYHLPEIFELDEWFARRLTEAR